MKCRGGRSLSFLEGLLTCPTEVPSAFGALLAFESQPFEGPVVVAVGKAFVQLAPGYDLYDLRAVRSTPLPVVTFQSRGSRALNSINGKIFVRGVSWNPRKDRLRLPGSTKISTILSSPVQLRSSGLRAWEQLKQRRVCYALHSGP
jgi:hypothetical protein